MTNASYPRAAVDRIVFLLVCATTLFWAGYETGEYVERWMKDAACVAVSKP